MISNIGKTDTCLATIETCSNNTYYVDSVTFVSVTSWLTNEVNFYCPWSSFPLELDPKLGYYENPIVFSPFNPYDKCGYAIFHVRGNNNEYFKRYIILRTVGQELNSIQENDAIGQYLIYPNPVKDYFYISGLDEYSFIDVNIYNIAGRKILEQKNHNKDAIHVEHLENGIYFVFIGYKSNLYFSKIIISR